MSWQIISIELQGQVLALRRHTFANNLLVCLNEAFIFWTPGVDSGSGAGAPWYRFVFELGVRPAPEDEDSA